MINDLEFLCLVFVQYAGDAHDRDFFREWGVVGGGVGGGGQLQFLLTHRYKYNAIFFLVIVAICFVFVATCDPSIEVISLMKALHVLNLHWTTLYEVSMTVMSTV